MNRPLSDLLSVLLSPSSVILVRQTRRQLVGLGAQSNLSGIELGVRSNSVRDVHGLRDTNGQSASTNQPRLSPGCAGHVGSGI